MVSGKKNRRPVINTCCGSYLKKNTKPVSDPFPVNPKILNGKALIYLGSGMRTIKGSESGNIYHVSEQHRHFVVEPEDVVSILRHSFIIRKP